MHGEIDSCSIWYLNSCAVFLKRFYEEIPFKETRLHDLIMIMIMIITIRYIHNCFGILVCSLWPVELDNTLYHFFCWIFVITTNVWDCFERCVECTCFVHLYI